MGATSSRHHRVKHRPMDGCPSSPPNTSSLVEYYHHHFAAVLTSSSYGLSTAAAQSSNNPHKKETLGSLNEMYAKLRSLESAESGNRHLFDDTLSPNIISDTMATHGPSPLRWHIDSAQVVASEAIDIRDVMSGFEEEALLPQGLSAKQRSRAISCTAQTDQAFHVSRCSNKKLKKSCHILEEVHHCKKSCLIILNDAGENEYDSAKENSMPKGVQCVTTVRPMSVQSPFNSAKSTMMSKSEKGRGSPPSNGSSREERIMTASMTGPLMRTRQHQKRPGAPLSPLSSDVIGGSNLAMEPTSPLFDPNLVASYEKALNSISPDSWNACLVDSSSHETPQRAPCVGQKETYFCRSKPTRLVLDKKLYDPLQSFERRCPPRSDKALVLYTTTLRGIRKTFEDCNMVRSIFQSFGLSMDERDVSMHLEFLNELRGLMGRMMSVPRVFIKGRYIGGIEEIRKLHEDSKLGELVEGLPKDVNGGNCDGCGGVRFLPCLECNGSRKVRHEGKEVTRCPDCNENGLIQCPICT